MSKEQEMPTASESLKAQNESDKTELDETETDETEAEPAIQTRHEMLESAPSYCNEIAALRSWSDNCVHPTPYVLFLDLIGWTAEHFGETVVSEISDVNLGYVELGYLADALQEYAKRPHDVSDWIDKLESCQE